MGSLSASSPDFDSLFREYHRELGAFAYRKLRDREAASDLVQDAFVRYIAHARDAEQATETPRFFLWRIASNLILDIGRRERRRGDTRARRGRPARARRPRTLGRARAVGAAGSN